MDKATEILIDALRQGAQDAGEHRLYRSGKLPGLFAARTSAHADVAAQAIRDGFIEIVRSETKGKTIAEWVRVTAKGIDFVLQHDSPLRALEDLKTALAINEQGIPSWVVDLREKIDLLGEKLAEEVNGLRRKLELTAVQVGDALKRLEKFGGPGVENVAWGHDAMNYLEQRKASGVGERCPLPELFSHVRRHEAELSLRDFHLGLRKLSHRGLVTLHPVEPGQGPEQPEYALLDGPEVYYYAGR
ncbi:MAG: hypothetical protein K2X38_14570 [Gemmataceae bacterium]|nr:hypothetical protein [Gemmataceae bacterium]